MASGPRYRHESRDTIIEALDIMLENLNQHLEITDSVSLKLDTLEVQRSIEKDLDIECTDAETQKHVDESRDQSTAEIGHIQKRIAEVMYLKEAFASAKQPSLEILQNTYRALYDSIVFESIKRYGLVLNSDKSKWCSKRLEEDEREKRSIHLYAQALMLGFGTWPQMRWYRFPFDRP